jgi:molecular chaperone GrpE
MLSLLPVLDDLERALNSIPPKATKRPWVEGIRLIERKLRASLEAQGLTPIKALGEPFDPNFHEAVRQDKGKEGIVIEELQKGYKLYDRVLRPAMVVVGNGEEVEKEGR